MLGIYVDETGNTGSNINDLAQRFHYVGALVVPEKSWMGVSDDLQSIAVDALGKRHAAAAGFEFHGNQLFTGNGPWASITDRDARLKIYGKSLNLLHKHKLSFAYARCDKQQLRRYSTPMHPHEISFWLALERIGNITKEHDTLGFIIADEGSPRLKQIARSGLEAYRKHGPPFGRPTDITRIIDTVHFMDSCQSPHLQLCDLCLWVIQRYRATATGALPMGAFQDSDPPTIPQLYRRIVNRLAASVTFPY